MLDSVLIRAPRADAASLSDLRETADPATGIVTVSGHVSNFAVRIYPDGVARVQGSLPRFLTGDNSFLLRRVDVLEAVERLGDVLGFDPKVARVFSLHVGATLLMPRPPVAYLRLLSSAPRLRRVAFSGESVAFRNGRRKLLVYDKAKEAKKRGNLLRVEVQYQRKLKAQFDRSVYLCDLYDEEFFAELVQRWRNEYAGINKRRRHEMRAPDTPKDFVEQLAMIGLERFGGADAVFEQLQEWQEAGMLDRTTASRIRAKIRTLAAEGACPDDNAAAVELDRAIDAAATAALS